jgi:hypothetical protein
LSKTSSPLFFSELRKGFSLSEGREKLFFYLVYGVKLSQAGRGEGAEAQLFSFLLVRL